MNNAPVKFGIVGCGRVSAKHFQALTDKTLPSTLVAACDIVLDRAKAAAERYQIKAYSSQEQMLEAHPEIEVVNILTPSGTHAEQCVIAANHRRHVIVEKPLALKMEDAEAMIRACEDAGVRLFVVKQNRFNIPIQKLRQAIEERRFGKLVLGTARVRWCRTQAYYDSDPWRGTWKMDGGVLANQASHHIDLLTWMMGPVESVFAQSSTRLVNIEADDTACVILKFVNGALGMIEATTATRPNDMEGSISILGENGAVEVGGFAANELRVWQFADQKEDDPLVKAKYRENPKDVYGFGHQRFLDNVIQALKNKQAGLIDGLEGMKSIQLINAIYESIETKREITVNFRPHHSRLGVG